MTMSFSPGQAGLSKGTCTPVAKCASGAAQVNAAVLPALPGLATYVEGFDVTGDGATAGSVIEITVTGLQTQTGTLKFEMAVLAGAGAPCNAQGGLFVRFPEPLAAVALNSGITVTVPSFGAGNTTAAVVAYGFQA